MALIYWVGNAQYTAQVVSGTVGAVAAGGVLSATINEKTLSYECTADDTVDTAAANFAAVLSGSEVPPEFGEIGFTSVDEVVLATAATAGTPFAGMSGGLVFSGTGGATIVQAEEVANCSPNDVSNPINWRTVAGVSALPGAGDEIVLQASTVGLWWNLNYFRGISFVSITRWGDYTGTIGLLPQNPGGYLEYRPQYFACGPHSAGSSSAGPGTPIQVTLGLGSGNGPQYESWDVGTQNASLNVLGGQAIRFLGTHGSNSGTIVGATVGVAQSAGEASSFASLDVDGGANVTLGLGVSFSGTLNVTNGQATTFVAPASIIASNSATVTVRSQDLTHPVVFAEGGSTVTWISNSDITTLTLESQATLDKSQSIQDMTITNSTIDGANCQVLDSFSTITWTNATVVTGQVTSGPFTFLGPRQVKIT